MADLTAPDAAEQKAGEKVNMDGTKIKFPAQRLKHYDCCKKQQGCRQASQQSPVWPASGLYIVFE